MACPALKRLGLCIALLALVSFYAAPAAAANSGAVEAAKSAALAWLGQVDRGGYAGSWEESGTFFQGAVAKENWVRQLSGVRKPLGKTLSRELVASKALQSLPGAPDGSYMLLLFKASFANKKAAEERVTLIDEKGRGWRVVGYFIK